MRQAASPPGLGQRGAAGAPTRQRRTLAFPRPPQRPQDTDVPARATQTQTAGLFKGTRWQNADLDLGTDRDVTMQRPEGTERERETRTDHGHPLEEELLQETEERFR